MRLSTLALYSCLVAAAASAHISSINKVGESSTFALLARDTASASSSITNLSLAKREAEAIEVEEDDDNDDDDEEGTLESRARKHKHRKHHRSRKHSSAKGHRRSGHKKNHKHHSHSHSVTHSTTHGGFKGKGTFFRPNQGACGAWNTVNDHIVALSADVYKGGKRCFQGVNVCYDGKCVAAKVADLCPECRKTSLDMSPSLFKALADPDLGIIDISWSFT